MTDNFEKKVAVDGPVVNAGELRLVHVFPRPGFAGPGLAGTWPAMDGGGASVRSFCGFCVTSRCNFCRASWA